MQPAFHRPHRPKRRSASTLLLLMLAALSLLSFAACGGGQTTQVSSETGTPTGTAPPRTMYPVPPASTSAPGSSATGTQTFTLLDSRRARVSDYLGQVVVLDFYATWCGPCRIETPHLVELHHRYWRQGLRIVGLNVGGPEDRDKVPGYIEEFRIPYTLAYPDPAMSDLYLSDDDSIPQLFVFDRQGRLIKRFISYDDRMPAELDRIIQSALEKQG